MGCLYEVKCKINGKSYIGITSGTAENRFRYHSTPSNARKKRRKLLSRAIVKYGKENFIISTLVISNDMEYLGLLEIKAIDAFKTLFPNGYNLSNGGEYSCVNLTRESRNRISRSLEKLWKNADYRKKVTDAHRGWIPHANTKKNLDKGRDLYSLPLFKKSKSLRQKERWADPEYRARRIQELQSNRIKGRSSESMKKKWQDPEYIYNWRAARKPPTEEANLKRHIASKAWWSDEERRLTQKERMSLWKDKSFIKIKQTTPYQKNCRVCSLWCELPQALTYRDFLKRGFTSRHVSLAIKLGALKVVED